MDQEMTTGGQPPKQTDTLHLVGLVLTALWITLVAIYLVWKRDKIGALDPDALADFASGAFAPLAFLWLVLGFFQQGQELRNSGRALWLQGEELRNSVEQQRELVGVTREQLKFESEMLQSQKAEILRTSRPVFKLEIAGTISRGTGNHYHYTFQLTNVGRPCTDVTIEYFDTRKSQSSMETGATAEFGVGVKGDQKRASRVTITYLDERLIEGRTDFFVIVEGNEHIIRRVPTQMELAELEALANEDAVEGAVGDT